MKFGDVLLSIGDTIYFCDSNIRVYKDDLGHTTSAPNKRFMYSAVIIYGETKVSWKVRYQGRDRTVNKKTGAIGGELYGLGQFAIPTVTEVENAIFLDTNAYTISQQVLLCKNPDILRSIKAILEANHE